MPRDPRRSRYHPIEDGLWSDEKFDARDGMPAAKFLPRAFLAFLATNALERPSGIYRATDDQLASLAFLPTKEVTSLIAELERRGMVVRDGAWIFLPGYLKRQGQNSNLLRAVASNLLSCSSQKILCEFKRKYPLLLHLCTTDSKTMDNPSAHLVQIGTTVPVPAPVPEQYQKELNVGSHDPTAFALLWKSYPAPKGPKQDALKAFKEVKPPENVIALLQAQIAYKQSCDTRGEFCSQLPHLHRWLKKRRWEDEIPAAEKPIEYPRMEDPKIAWKTQERYLEARAAGRVSPRERVAEWEPAASPA